MTTTASLPPEWTPHRALWVGWPRLPEEWGGADAMAAARREIAGFVEAAARYVPVRLAVGDDRAAEAALSAGLADHAQIVRVPTGDIWLRDTGPVFGRKGGLPLAHLFRFNGWGEKYLMPGDAETASAVADEEGAAIRRHDVVLEGGSIDTDGEGRVLTTSECLLNPNRNGRDFGREAAEAVLAALGLTDVVWLDRGLPNDHTDGHIDNIARFVGPGHAVCQHAEKDHPHHAHLVAAEEQLCAAGLEVTTIPAPAPVRDDDGEALPASHMNFTITNGAVLLPIYDEATGAAAAEALRPLFPDRDIIALPARAILVGGGSFHCMTCHVPAEEGAS